MSSTRFRYALAPVALQRQWALDAVLVELGECNQLLAGRRAEQAALDAQVLQAQQELRTQAGAGALLRLERYTLVTEYLADRQRAVQQVRHAIADLQERREAIITQLSAARRAVDVMDRHRAQAHKEFIRELLSGQFKLADEQWNAAQTVKVNNGD